MISSFLAYLERQSSQVSSPNPSQGNYISFELQHTVFGQMEESRWCLYLPGICMHVSPVSSEEGNSELHLDLDEPPEGFSFRCFEPPPLHLHPAFQPSTPPSLHELFTLPTMSSATLSTPASPLSKDSDGSFPTTLIGHDKAFENTSTSVAASQMRNALNNLADTVADPEEKKV